MWHEKLHYFKKSEKKKVILTILHLHSKFTLFIFKELDAETSKSSYIVNVVIKMFFLGKTYSKKMLVKVKTFNLFL